MIPRPDPARAVSAPDEADAPVKVRRPRARRGEGAQLYDEILTAATDLLVRTGDKDAVTIRAVAAAVGVTPPSVYLHFADKDELMFAVCQQQFQALADAIDAAVADATDPFAALREGTHAYVRFGLDHPEDYRVLFMSKASEAPPSFGEREIMQSAAFDHLVETVKACQRAGAVSPDFDPQVASLTVWAMAHGICSLLISKPALAWPPVDVLVDFAIDLWSLHPTGDGAAPG